MYWRQSSFFLNDKYKVKFLGTKKKKVSFELEFHKDQGKIKEEINQ